jgi:hypothetical protein
MNRQTRPFVFALFSPLAVSHWSFAQGSSESLYGEI